jgi:hypothetical protein
MLYIFDEELGDFVGWQHLVGVAGVHQAARHSGEFSAVRILRDAQSPDRFHQLRACRAVGAGPRKNDDDGLVPLLAGQGPEEVIDRPAMSPPFHRLAQVQAPSSDMVTVKPGRMTYTELGLTSIPSSIRKTGMAVVRPRISGMKLWVEGARCWITTNAIPLSAGAAVKNADSA